MPQPSLSQVHVNRPLTDMSVAFLQSAEDFVSGRVFPDLMVNKKSDDYFEYPRGFWAADEMKKRAPGTESAGGGYEVQTKSYNCDVWALHKDVPDQIRDNADEALNPDREATEWLTQQWMIRKEREWGTNFFTTGLWTGSTTGSDIVPGTKWDNASSDPIADVRAQVRSMKLKSGQRPNKMVVTPVVDEALRVNATIREMVKYVQPTGADDITPALLASLFGIGEYLVAEGAVNTAKEGATATFEYILGSDQVGLFYAAPSPGLMTPSAGYVFGWRYPGGGANGQTIANFRMEHLKCDRVEIEASWDQKLIASDMGVFFNDVLT